MYKRVKQVYDELLTKDETFKQDIQTGSVLTLVVSHLMGNRYAYYKNRHTYVDLKDIFGDCEFYSKISTITVSSIFGYKNLCEDYFKFCRVFEDAKSANIRFGVFPTVLYPRVGSIFSKSDSGTVIEHCSRIREVLKGTDVKDYHILRLNRSEFGWYFTRYTGTCIYSDEISEFPELEEVCYWISSLDFGNVRSLYWFPSCIDSGEFRYYGDKGNIIVS